MTKGSTMKRPARVLVGATALALGALTTTVPAAQAAPGEKSLYEVLTSDGNKFDRNAKDFDIVTQAALAVIAADDESPVAILADGSKRLTAFAPTDQAFRLLVKDLTGQTVRKEKRVLRKLVNLAGVETVETVLLYHVVPGQTLTSRKVLKSDGARLTTAEGSTIKVDVRKKPKLRIILKDKDRDARNPRVILGAVDINKGNKQIAHGIDRVLRPIDL
jgi:uncharacterized surface protein with fasciclin (FAS1) repeats